MRVKATPTTETVERLMNVQLEDYEARIGAAESKLEALNQQTILYNPGTTSLIQAAKDEIEYLKTESESLKTKLEIIDATLAPRVLVEFDL